MRAAFAATLTELAAEHPEILLLTADLGFMALEPFAERHPGQFLNVGVAEQNMIGICTGLSEAGFVPFAYSIATFASLRGYEFIRNGPILHNLPVRVVGIGGGFEYGHAGTTHHSLEDIAVFRTQPGMTIVAPADAEQTVSAIRQTWNYPGPIYYRLGKDDRIRVPGLQGRFELGKAHTVREGTDFALFATGSISADAVAVADLLASRGISARVVVVSSFNPSPTEDIVAALQGASIAATIEAHYVSGALGSFVAETIAEHGLGTRLVRFGVTRPRTATGSQDYLHALHGLDPTSIADRLANVIAVA
jgi:transketolase